MKDINVVAEKMARNGRKIANSLGCAFHYESEFRIVKQTMSEIFRILTAYLRIFVLNKVYISVHWLSSIQGKDTRIESTCSKEMILFCE